MSWWHDLRLTARGLLRVPAFTFGVVLTLGLGLGLNAVMLTLLDRLLIEAPAGLVEPDRVARLYLQELPGTPNASASMAMRYPIYTDLLTQDGGFAQLAAVARRSRIYGEGVNRRRMTIEGVSASYWTLVGVTPALGRFFTDADDRAGTEPAAVITWDFWQHELGGDPAVLGRHLDLEVHDYTIIGVAPRGFGGLDLEPAEAFVPIVQGALLGDLVHPGALTARGTTWMAIFGRLKPGVSADLAAQLATPVLQAGMRGTPGWDSTARILAGPVQEFRRPVMSKGVRQSLWIGLAAAAVLLIACANITNLLLSRGMTRERELAIRASLGAGRGGLVRVILGESLLLSLAGGVLALFVAIWAGVLLRDLIFPWLPDAPVLSPRFFAFLAFAVGITTLLTGLVPAIQLSRFELARGLRRGSRGATRTGQRTRNLLLVGQVGLTLLLLVGAGLFLRSVQRTLAIETGVTPHDVYGVSPRLTGPAFEQPGQETAFYTDLLERLQRRPSVEHAALTSGQPFSTARQLVALRAEGRGDTLPREERPFIQAVTPDYLVTMGTPVLRGRSFTAADDAGAEPVAIVTTTMAARLWPGSDPLGKCLYRDNGTRCTRVIGLAVDTKLMSLTEDAKALCYVPLAQEPGERIDGLYIRVRPGTGDPTLLVRQVIEQTPAAPWTTVSSFAEQIDGQRDSWLHMATLFSLFSLLGLLLAAVGIFSVLSYGIAQRTREIGIRMALGARHRQVIRMVIRQGVGAAMAGIILGGIAAWFFARAIAPLLYQVPPADPLVFAGTAAILLVVAFAASWAPARRATRIEPMIALRSE